MAYYDALIAKWATLTPGTTAAKLAQINALTVTFAGKALLAPSQILNTVVFADLAALNQLQITQLTLLLQGAQVDASVGTPIRLGIQTLFSGKTTTLNQLAALVAPLDNVVMPWWQATVAQGGCGFGAPINAEDLNRAGGLT